MKILLMAVGKTDSEYIAAGFREYEQRLKKYISFEFKVIPDIRHRGRLPVQEQKEREGAAILKMLPAGDLILLDEKGTTYTSAGFSEFLNQKMISGQKQLIFIIGGPYGFSEEVLRRAKGMVSLSAMTYSHQLVRLVFVEQLYRAFTILKGEPYHHE
jgi:23S rRNA (pseudouridine1915-N3)-methyltransferase